MYVPPAQPAGHQAVRDALADVSGLGPFFVIGAGSEDGAWRLARESYADGWSARVAAVGRRLGTSEVRVAAAIVQFGFAARLWSAALACAVLHGIVIDLTDLRISADDPVALLLPDPGARGVPDDTQAGLADALYAEVADRHLRPLAQALADRVATGLLWGNAASAIVAASQIVADAHPSQLRAARIMAERLLGTGSLRGTGRLAPAGLAFRRNSCCLYYRVPGGGLCGDCSLAGRRR